MPLEEDINAFVLWATKLGFPLEDMPNDEAIKSIFKSRQRNVLSNLIKRVHPRQKVLEIRENILIKKLEKIKDQVIPECSRNFLPNEMQLFFKVRDLKAHKLEVEMRIDEYRKEYDVLAGSIKTKNMQNMKLQQKHDMLQAKVNLLDVKSLSLGKDISKEQQNKQLLMATMPVKLTAKNACETVGVAAVETALRDLDKFYNLYMNDTNPNVLQDAKDDLWQKLRITFADIPNFMLFNAIVRLKEEQLQNIMTLNKSNNDDSHTRTLVSINLSAGGGREPYSTFELKLMKTKAELLGIVAKYLAAQHECAVLEERFSNAYPEFVDELQKKVNLFNTDTEENTDDIISDYIVQYNFRNFSKSQNEFLTQQIELYKAHLETGARQLDDHVVLLGSIKQVYAEISTSINRIQYEMLQLNQIKQKILYSKNMLQHMLNDLQASNAANAAANNAKSNFMPTKLKPSGNNASMMGGESFELSGDNVFSSTKLDFDSTMLSSLNNTALVRSFGDTTLLPTVNHAAPVARYTLPPHLTEFCTFAEIPLEKFSCITKECSFYLSPNPLIVASRELSSTIQLAPGTLLTPFGALQEVRNRIQWADTIKDISGDLKLDLELTIVDPQAFRLKIKKQRDQISELLDKIDVSVINTNHALHKVAKLYDFMLENPLRNYIPASKCFNNQTYLDYESEFTMYYRMATVGASIK